MVKAENRMVMRKRNRLRFAQSETDEEGRTDYAMVKLILMPKTGDDAADELMMIIKSILTVLLLSSLLSLCCHHDRHLWRSLQRADVEITVQSKCFFFWWEPLFLGFARPPP